MRIDKTWNSPALESFWFDRPNVHCIEGKTVISRWSVVQYSDIMRRLSNYVNVTKCLSSAKYV